MSNLQDILINVQPWETRISALQGSELQELQLEPSRDSSLVGNIYKGKVSRVVPEMQAAFVDLGITSNGFLPVSELHEHKQSSSKLQIEEILHEGKSVWVQVTRDAIAGKGPRLTTNLSIATANLMYQAYGRGVGISQRIADPAKRSELKKQVESLLADSEFSSGGIIVRTNALLTSEQQLHSDLQYLQTEWRRISDAMRQAKPGDVVYREPSLAHTFVRDFSRQQLGTVTIDCPLLYAQLQTDFPELQERLVLCKDSEPLFEEYGIEAQIDSALHATVTVDNNVNLIIEQTSSMTTVDVNSNSERACEANLRAVPEIARQLRLRNIGGIVIVDFIDMAKRKQKDSVVAAMQEALQKDSVVTTVGEISSLGLMEITRQRVRPSLQELVCEPCNSCNQTGMVKSMESVCYEIFRRLKSKAQQSSDKGCTVAASVELIELLQNEQAENLKNVQEWWNQPINLRLEAHYSAQRYEIVLS